MGREKVVARTTPAGTPTRTRDATLNDSDKTFTVGANRRQRMVSIFVDITTTVTAGNRIITIAFGDGTNEILRQANLTAVVASSTNAYIRFAVGNPYAASATNAYVPLPADFWLSAGYTIRVYDANGVDAAADDMTVVLYYEELDV
jgi:hypothetical protein